MTLSARAEVNQRLYFCQLHFAALARMRADGETQLSILDEAFSESLVFHLYATYRCYLREIAEACQLSGGVCDSAQQLLELLAARQQEPAELKELAALEQQQGSWLQRLCNDFVEQMSAPAVQARGVQTQASLTGGDIALHAQPDRNADALLDSWQSLRALIERQRDFLAEW